MYHTYETTHHHFARREICYDAVTQRAHGPDAVVGLLIHTLCTLANSYHLIGVTVYCDYRRLVDNNLVTLHDDGVGGAEVHSDLLNEGEKSKVHILVCISVYFFVETNQELIAVS